MGLDHSSLALISCMQWESPSPVAAYILPATYCPLILVLSPLELLQAVRSFFFFFLLFRATPTAHGDSQARGPIGATAAGLTNSNSNSKLRLRPIP